MNVEEIEKFNTFQKEITKESDFLKKIKDIFNLQNSENFQDILILQKHKYIDQVEKESLYILKKIYSDKIINNRKFTSLFQSGKDEFVSNYNNNYKEILSEWEYFNDLKKNNNPDYEEEINSYYLTDFRKHCHNHEGLAWHKCGHGEKGRFIKIYIKSNGRFRTNKEFKYVICEECKKAYNKDLFYNYCLYCKESYFCSILSPSENKEYYLATYASPHCDTFINKTIPCKLCQEKLYIFINDRKVKCLKCNYVLDINNKNELQWQCTKCNKFFRSKVKIFNSCENIILNRILKKALLLKIKARPQFMNCCDIDINNTDFFHKKECKGILYLCNVENYFLKNKKWVIVCDKCHSINNSKNFIWTCPLCGKKARETNNIKEETIKSPLRKDNVKINNINRVEKNNVKEYSSKESKPNLFQKYLSNYMIKKTSLSSVSNDDANKKRRKNIYESFDINGNKKEEKEKKNNNKEKQQNISKVLQDNNNNNNNNKNRINIATNDISNDNNNLELKGKYFFRSKRYKKNQINLSNNNSRYRNSRDNININVNEYNNNADIKKEENTIPLPFNRMDYVRKKNSIIHMNMNNMKEEEKNREQKYQRADSYKSSGALDYRDGKNEEYFAQNNYDNNKNMNNKKSFIFNFKNKNIPVRLRYNNDNNNNNINYNNYVKNNKNKDYKKSVDFANPKNNIIIKDYAKKEEISDRNKRLLFKSADENISNGEGRISKESTTYGSKGSVTSSSKDNNSNNNNYYYNNNYNSNFKKADNNNIGNNGKGEDCFYSTLTNFNFKNRRKYYMKEKEKESENEKSNNNNVKNLKNNIKKNEIQNNSNYKTCKQVLELDDINVKNTNKERTLTTPNKIKKNDKPDDVIEPEDINYTDDIPIYDFKIKQNKELYDNIQKGIKAILEKGRLPQFNIDNYTIEKKIGDGAFGVLFSVMNNKTKKKYALKKLTAHDTKQLEDFQKEFEIAYHSTHENILGLYGICIRIYDSTTFALFVLMDLAERDWEVEIIKRFKEKRYYTEEELIKILKQLASALVYLQKKEIAHRDIKPENILLFFENEKKVTFKICDFGEAKEKIKVNSRHKSIRGTDYYMSPILFKGLTSEEKYVRDNAYKSDVFSLGFCMIIAGVLDFDFINKIRNVEEQTKLDKIIRESLEERYSFKFIRVLLKMIILHEKDRIDFLGLEQLIKDEL